MKKLLKVLFVALIAIGLATPVSAAGSITADEQRILDELNKGATVGGKHFNLPQSDITKAENHLKTKDVSSADVNKIVKNIIQARGILAGQNIKAANGQELREKLPADVYGQIMALVNDSFSILGLSGDPTPNPGGSGGGKSGGLVDKSTGKPLASTGSIVKTTGANYSTSLVVFASLMITAVAAVFVGKKYTNVA